MLYIHQGVLKFLEHALNFLNYPISWAESLTGVKKFHELNGGKFCKVVYF